MKQVLQSLGSGETRLVDVPAPTVRPGCLLIRSQASLISLGTEKMLIDFGRANLISKARQQPDKVRQVVEKARTDGILPTMDAVRAKLDQPIPLGYCNAGVCIAVGEGVQGFSVGDRVVSNGPHAEWVCIPQNLCARIPDGVSSEQASFTVAGAVALQGVRLAKPDLGESFVVIGLGLIGLLAVQLLRSNGCRVIGIDFDSSKCALARKLGADTVDLSQGEDPLSRASAFSRGRGVDGVLITASTRSNDVVHQAAQMSRKRGRIILVGVVGLDLQRGDFYEKELTFQVSCSYGPGRYDEDYEIKGRDYPIGFVRWTLQRNFEAFLDQVASNRVQTEPLVTHRFPFDEALTGYESVAEKGALGIILTYPRSDDSDNLQQPSTFVRLLERSRNPTEDRAVVGMIGAGAFSGKVLLPALAHTGVRLHTIVSRNGVSGSHLGRKFKFECSASDASAVIENDEINTVFVTTPHNSHGRFVLECLRRGKHVFVEKPLCLSETELDEIRSNYGDSLERGRAPLLMVGFNRRFAPQVARIKSLLAPMSVPKAFVMTVNAGAIPADHWTQDLQTGGGRLLGEGCHFVDLLRFLADASIESVSAHSAAGEGTECNDTFSIFLRFSDGSIGTVHYFANGSRAFPKERLEVFCGGRTLQLDNFRTLRGFGWPGFKRDKSMRQDKGHNAEVTAFIRAIQEGGDAPIPASQLFEVSAACFDAHAQIWQ